jgi:hypothetical protein
VKTIRVVLVVVGWLVALAVVSAIDEWLSLRAERRQP